MNDSMTLKITDDSGVEHIYDGHAALFAIDLTSQNNRLRAKNAELREALEMFCGNVGIYEASSFVKTRFPVTWQEGHALLQPAAARATGIEVGE